MPTDVRVHEAAPASHPRLQDALPLSDAERSTELPHELLYSLLAYGAGLSNEVAPLLALHLEQPSLPVHACGTEAREREALRRALWSS